MVMTYMSVWNDDNIINRDENKMENANKHYNKWIPLTDNKDRVITIGRYEDNYEGVRTIIGGSSNHLMFITYFPKNISVFNLNTFQYVKYAGLPIDNLIRCHCFVPKGKTRSKIAEMMLFHQKTGLAIAYNEEDNSLQFHAIR
ncbi:hypothetical protein RFI_32495, partial [Reticulomyxa filosa]